MPKFLYKAVSSEGQLLEGVIDAASHDSAIDRLQNSGHLPISADEIAHDKPSKAKINLPVFNSKRVTSKDIDILTRELATLLRAGLPLDNALTTLEQLSDKSAVKSLVQDLHARVQGGASLSEAMKEQDAVFSRLYLNMIRAGETGGAIDTVLERLAEYLESAADLKASIISALIYPIILFIVATFSVLALLLFVVPQFIPLFEDAGKTLPLLTQIVFGVAGFFNQFWWLFLCLICALALIIDTQLRNPEKRYYLDTLLLKLPLFSSLIIKLEVSRFSRTLGTLLKNGVPLLTGVSIVSEVINNRQLAKIIDSVTSSLEQGHSLTQPLKQSELIPPLAVQLIQVGEETGQLDNMLLKVADIYDKESRTSIERMLTLLEPLLILWLGAVIALIIVSILLAILGLNELVI